MAKKVKKTLRVTVRIPCSTYQPPVPKPLHYNEEYWKLGFKTDESGVEITNFFCEIPLPNKRNTTRFLKTIKETYKEGIKVEIF